jgi:hypothetical protein
MPKSQDTNMQMLEAMALSGLGKPIEPCEVIRDITRADLPLLAQEQKERNWRTDEGPRMLTALRTGHHQLAQLLAAKVSVVDASLMTGRSMSAISSLQSDPAFKELMAYYEQQQEGRDFDAYKRLVTLGGTAMEILQERMEDQPDKFSNNELRQIMESTMDRSAAPAKGDPRQGQGKSGGPSVTINFVPSRPVQPVIEGEVLDLKPLAIEEKKDA